jgi:hypothetical protein
MVVSLSVLESLDTLAVPFAAQVEAGEVEDYAKGRRAKRRFSRSYLSWNPLEVTSTPL